MTNLDADLADADWPKRTWDFYVVVDRRPELVDTADAFLAMIGVADEPLTVQQERVALFMRAPSASAMPDGLRGELRGRGLL